ncbi:hypothetical protein C4564_01875 [Candidatus Microgenomates bacterium]|nr:MAG: hypothetical protein C4564_01875 [Candidatus Microgenomates bacterium]
MIVEHAVDEQGNVLWNEAYVFNSLSAKGEKIIRNYKTYIVVSSKFVSDDVIETVLRPAIRGGEE